MGQECGRNIGGPLSNQSNRGKWTQIWEVPIEGSLGFRPKLQAVVVFDVSNMAFRIPKSIGNAATIYRVLHSNSLLLQCGSVEMNRKISAYSLFLTPRINQQYMSKTNPLKSENEICSVGSVILLELGIQNENESCLFVLDGLRFNYEFC